MPWAMCKRTGNTYCSVFGRDVTSWSHDAPMGQPEWVAAAFDPLLEAMTLADAGDITASLALYHREVPDRKLNEWYDLHAQYAYKWRCTDRGIPSPKKLPAEQLAPKLGNPESALPQQVFARDSYRCRYCNTRLFAYPAFTRFEQTVGREAFTVTKSPGNKAKAGAAMVFRPTADHVEPWSRGGQTGLANLVTSCWPCNFGKMEYTVAEMGITDPRLRPAIDDGWDGLRTPRA
jgi:hypothetical protein